MAQDPNSRSVPRSVRSNLDFRDRLSQVWMNRWTVLIFLVIVRCLFAFSTASSNLSAARREALAACTEVEGIASAMASMPHYMAAGLNEITATGVENAVSGLMEMLELAVTGVEELVVFVVHMMASTYLCLITLAVRGSVKTASDFSQMATESLQKATSEVTNSLRDTSKTISDDLSSIRDKMEKIPLMRSVQLPKIDFTNQINSITTLEFPQVLRQQLDRLNKSIPAFDDIQKLVENTTRIPFDQVKKQIQGISAFHFNRTLLPVPEKAHLDFCTKNNAISLFFEGLIKKLTEIRNKMLISLIIVAVFVGIPLAAWAHYHENKRLEKTKTTAKDASSIAHDQRKRPGSGNTMKAEACEENRREHGKQWLFAYATSPPMLLVLTLGLAGLMSCALQLLVAMNINRASPKLTNQVADFAGEVMRSLGNSSTFWSNGVNEAIRKLDEQLNGDIFGFVNTTTSAVNSTLDAFVERTSTEINNVLGGTVLHDPIKEVINCLIGLKIASFQSGLTWVHDHAHVSFPIVNNQTFGLGTLAQLSGSHSAANLLANTNNQATDLVTATLTRVANKHMSSIRMEALVSGLLVSCWLLTTAGGGLYITYRIVSHEFPFQWHQNPFITHK
ncbi:hypothetical protein GQ44DRAFT_732030 [Phaeosphaeriaceae sp. PMI808]|nr:hypothetical protein GQ44DRAFT_732030 [Phaeosphaeriaceae sp. PMI808]